MNRLIEILFWTVLLLAIVGLMCVWLAVKAIGADFGATDLVAKPPLFPAEKAPTHLAAPSDSIGLTPVESRVTHPAAVVPPATNKPIILPAFKYGVPGSNQMWLIQSSTNRGVWQTIAAGTNNVNTVSNRVWTTLLPFVLPAAGTLDVSNKAPSAAYRVMGVKKAIP